VGAVIELVEAVASWQSLLLVIAIFGFAPGFILRLLVKIYPRDDPRRQELVAELYTLGRIERPLFVAEQFETVLFEGLPHRAKSVWTSTRKRAGRARAWLSAGGYWEVAAWFAAAAGIADFFINKSVELMLFGVSVLVGGYVLKYAMWRVRNRPNRRNQARLRETIFRDLRHFAPDGQLEAKQTEAIQRIVEVMSRGGRAVLHGEWGTGKSLVLAIARRRLVNEATLKDLPIPVPINAWKWDTTNESLEDLITRELCDLLHLQPDQASKLLNNGNVVPFIDDLDRIMPFEIENILEQVAQRWIGRPVVLAADRSVAKVQLEDAEYIDLNVTYTGEQTWHRKFQRELYIRYFNTEETT
jgi:hypothetical protein